MFVKCEMFACDGRSRQDTVSLLFSLIFNIYLHVFYNVSRNFTSSNVKLLSA